ncbi:hypothetical protein D3C86_2231380 [compost metagenome]
MQQLNALQMSDARDLVEGIEQQHREHARLKLIGLGLGFCQLHKSLGQFQRLAHL